MSLWVFVISEPVENVQPARCSIMPKEIQLLVMDKKSPVPTRAHTRQGSMLEVRLERTVPQTLCAGTTSSERAQDVAPALSPMTSWAIMKAFPAAHRTILLKPSPLAGSRYHVAMGISLPAFS